MVGAFLFAIARPRRAARVVASPAPVAVAEPRSRILVRTIAELDESFDAATASETTRTEYESRRAALKAQLADALAAERGAS
jgi:hypothetical protein